MTNLKDLLNDFADDIKEVVINLDNPRIKVNWEIDKKERIEQLLKVITERLIGE